MWAGGGFRDRRFFLHQVRIGKIAEGIKPQSEEDKKGQGPYCEKDSFCQKTLHLFFIILLYGCNKDHVFLFRIKEKR